MDFFVFSNYTLDSLGRVDYPYSTLEGADIIPDITSSMWVEKYLEPGEFSFTCPIESQIRTICPIGSIISQVEAQETMIVENHEIVEDQDGQMEVKVSGRSFEVLLENRAIGQDGYLKEFHVAPAPRVGDVPLYSRNYGYIYPSISPYAGERWWGNRFGGNFPQGIDGRQEIGNNYVVQNTAQIWNGTPSSIIPGVVMNTVQTVGNFQRKSDIVEFIVNRLFGTPEAVYPNQDIPIDGLNSNYPFTPDRLYKYSVPNADTISFLVFINTDFRAKPALDLTFEYPVDDGDAHTAITKILATESMGIASARAGLTSPIDFQGHGIPHDWPESYKNKLALLVYYGNDRREAVEFSYAGGDVASANYLWSNRNEKNGYFINGEWRSLLNRGDVGYKQRTMYVDGSSVDSQLMETYWVLRNTGNTVALRDVHISVDLANNVIAKFRAFGNETLAQRENQRTVVMEAELVSQQKDLIYRRDYGTGDLVTVIGNHGLKETMQVIEYTETEDETGELAFPTLVIPSAKTIADLEKPVGQRI